MRAWLLEERFSASDKQVITNLIGDPQVKGVPVLEPNDHLGQWERQSLPLTVNNRFHTLFTTFLPYFTNEMQTIGDPTLQQEVEILQKLTQL
jgi:hypothetical protein